MRAKYDIDLVNLAAVCRQYIDTKLNVIVFKSIGVMNFYISSFMIIN